MKQKFEIGQWVHKWTGDYTGPGVVRGVSTFPNGKIRYQVGHTIEGGEGEFLHVYAAGNLRDCQPLNDLPNVSKEDGLRARNGFATPQSARLWNDRQGDD